MAHKNQFLKYDLYICAMAAHVDTGVRKILEWPIVYDTWQWLVGGAKARRRLIEDYIKPQSGQKILDIGCGTGQMLDYMPRDIDFVGYDIQEEYIEHAKKHYGDRGRFYCTRVNEMESFEADFDVVMVVGVLHHLDDQESNVLVEMARNALRPGGVFYLFEPIWLDGQSAGAKFFLKNDRGQNIRTIDEYRSLLDVHFDSINHHIDHKMFRIPYTISIIESSYSA